VPATGTRSDYAKPILWRHPLHQRPAKRALQLSSLGGLGRLADTAKVEASGASQFN
jgi:hypothetical protein